MRWWCGLLLVLVACDEPAPKTRRDAPPPPSVTASPPTAIAAVASSTQATPTGAPSRLPALLSRLRARHPHLLRAAAAHRLQIVVRWEHEGALVREAFRADAEYVYPASAIKPVAAVAALRTLRERWPDMAPGGRGVFLERCLDVNCEQRAGRAELAETIDATLRDSDNAGLAWLFDLVGRAKLNQPFWEAGLASVRFHHRMGETSDEGREHPPIHVNMGAKELVAQSERAPELPPHPVGETAVGEAHETPAGARLPRPMPFAAKNYVRLDDLQRLLVALVEPRLADVELGLDPRDRAFLVDVMSKPPSKPGAHRPLAPGLERVEGGAALRHVTKSGRAYGFTVVNAALRAPSGEWAFVTASLYANPDGVVNDDRYAYGQLAIPFLADLGEMVAEVLLAAPASEKD